MIFIMGASEAWMSLPGCGLTLLKLSSSGWAPASNFLGWTWLLICCLPSYYIFLCRARDLGVALDCEPRQQKFRAMNGAHLASPIRGELGYAHWPQLGTQFIALLGTKYAAH